MAAQTPLPPGTPWSLESALDRNEALGRLMQRLDESRRRFAVIQALLPPGLRGQVRPGPVEETGWVLLAPHGAAAAKLRQMLPAFEAALQRAGFPALPLKVRIHAA